MPGFPTRSLRDAFGPTIINRYPVRSPQYELDGAVIGNLMMAQLTGAGLTAVLAWLVVKIQSSGTTAAIISRDEAWNIEAEISGEFSPPNVVRASAGVLDITYPAQVPDYTDTPVPLTFKGGVAAYLDDNANPLLARVVPDQPYSSHVRVRGWLISGSSQTPTDGTLLIGLV
jgi:hypothetical protein